MFWLLQNIIRRGFAIVIVPQAEPETTESNSIKYALRPHCSAAMSVEPLPPNRSSTFSPGLEE